MGAPRNIRPRNPDLCQLTLEWKDFCIPRPSAGYDEVDDAGNKIEREIYLFEAENHAPDGTSKPLLERTCLVVGGTWDADAEQTANPIAINMPVGGATFIPVFTERHDPGNLIVFKGLGENTCLALGSWGTEITSSGLWPTGPTLRSGQALIRSRISSPSFNPQIQMLHNFLNDSLPVTKRNVSQK